MSLKDMLQADEIERFPHTPEELDNLLRMARRRLTDAQLIQLSPETRLVSAYQCVLGCAKAALRRHNYRVAHNYRQHFLMIRSLEFTLGLSPEEVAYCQGLRSKRHRDEYEGMLEASDTEADEAVAFAADLLARAIPTGTA
ncbi:MAG: hypothetical protein JW910_10970 [Anaerolineae bacterium]|nr:hypothetical protein [Anaerolineae bacterium]